jgi:hypothetical protein
VAAGGGFRRGGERMASDDNGHAGPGTGQADGRTGSPADQGGAGTGDTGTPAADRSSGGKSQDGETSGKGAATGQQQDTLGEGGLRGRRPAPDDQADNLFHADVKDDDLSEVYVQPDEYGQALQALTDHRVVVLQGKPGSGRHAMARHLLLHALAVERIADVGVNTEFGELKPRQKGSGHVLERCPPERARRLRAEHLRADRATLERCQGYLVITVDDGVPVLVGEESEQLVGCATTPALQLVLERHLDLYLRRRNGLQEEDREWLRGDTVRRYLARHGELRRTVRLARYLVRPLAAPPTPDRRQRLDSLLEAAESPQQRAKRQLELSQDVEHCSYVIALAVYEGGRPHAVADAAGLLAQRLAPGDPRGDTAWQPGKARARWLEQTGADRSGVVADEAGLLAQRLAPGDPRSGMAWHPGPPRADWLERAGAEVLNDRTEHAIVFNRTPVSRVQFKDPTLRSAILDRVWNELDELRGPVRDWLDALGGDPNPEVHERTAEAVGYLASHGFGYVYDLVIIPWTRRSSTTRAAAALALGALARDERFTRQVLALLSQWARWGDDARRRTAAIAHGRAVGLRMPAIALRELRRLAMRDGMQVPVAEELCQLSRRWRHREVVEALGEWTLRPERATWSEAERRVVYTGLRAFLVSTRVFDQHEDKGLWPILLALAEEDLDARERVVVLWRRALADDELAEWAAAHLCWWVLEADIQASGSGGDQPPLVPALRRLLAEVAHGGQAHAGRVLDSLNRCAHDREDPSDVARTLVDQLR